MSAAATASTSGSTSAAASLGPSFSSIWASLDNTIGNPQASASHTELGEPSERGMDTPTLAPRR
jgi:hypothetical protein